MTTGTSAAVVTTASFTAGFRPGVGPGACDVPDRAGVRGRGTAKPIVTGTGLPAASFAGLKRN